MPYPSARSFTSHSMGTLDLATLEGRLDDFPEPAFFCGVVSLPPLFLVDVVAFFAVAFVVLANLIVSFVAVALFAAAFLVVFFVLAPACLIIIILMGALVNILFFLRLFLSV